MTTTIEDVDLRLTATKAELLGADQGLRDSLEDERISRIAGDEANKQLTLDVQTSNQGTESRLSTEVIHRSEGDLVNVNSITALNQALSEYRIKTDLELAAEKLAREQLGITLDARITGAIASFDHREHLIYTAIAEVQSDVDNKYTSMDARIAKYEDMLQDITTDSIQITMDNGDINMGAWTILSQAREWDLEILGKFKDYQTKIDGDLNDALIDLQNKLPVEQDIIDKAIEQLSNAPIILELDAKLAKNIDDINALDLKVIQNANATADEMIALSQTLNDNLVEKTNTISAQVTQEATNRFNDIAKESETRIAQIQLLDDGLTQEISDRIDGDAHTIQLIDNLKVSNDADFANIRNELTVTTSKANANATAINALDARVTVNEANTGTALTNSASAVQRADAAVAANEATVARVTSIEAALDTKASTAALNALDTKVTNIDGKVTTQAGNITALQTRVGTTESNIAGNTSAISQLQTTQTQQGNQLTQVVSDVSVLKTDMTNVKAGVSANSSAITTVQGNVTTLDGKVTANTTAITNLQSSLATTNQNLSTKADASTVTALDTKVTNIDGRVVVNTNNISTLSGRVTTVENGLTTKADASALNNYYTKTQANTATAGQISSYDASLAIGGDNLLVNGDFKKDWASWNIWGNATREFVTLNGKRYAHLVATTTDLFKGISQTGVTPFIPDAQYTVSFLAYTTASTAQRIQMLVHQTGGYNNDPQINMFTPDITAVPKRYSLTFRTTNSSVKNALNIHIGGGFGTLYDVCVSDIKIELGNKATAWTPSAREVFSALDTNATAISNTNATVTNIDGRVTANSTSLTNLSARVTTVENGLATKADASAVSALTATVTQQGATQTAQGQSITQLTSKVDGITVGGRNYLLDSKTSGTKVIASTELSKILAPGSVISMSFDIDITSAVSAGSRNRIGYETNFAINGFTYYCGVFLNNAASQPIGKYRIKGQFIIPATWTAGSTVFPSSFPYIVQTSGGAFTVSNVKMEVGTLHTDWLPATEDMATASAVNILDTKVTNIDGRVTTQASTLTQIQTDVAGNSAAIQVQGNTINGIKAEYTIKLDVNGLVAGIGLINDGTSTAIGMNADYFYIGKPSSGKKPFIVTTSSQTIGGVTYPAGTWIDVAMIASATIGSAHIGSAAITNAKIANLAVDNAKIADLTIQGAKIANAAIGTAKIANLAVTNALIADAAITNAKIANAAIQSANIADLAVDTLKIANNAVTVQTVFNLNSWQGSTARAYVYYTGWWCAQHTVEYKQDGIYSTAALGQISLGAYTGTVLVTLTIGHVYAGGASPWFFIQRVSNGEVTQHKLYSNSGSNFICIRKAYENVQANESFRFFLATGSGQANTLITLGSVSFTLEGAKK